MGSYLGPYPSRLYILALLSAGLGHGAIIYLAVSTTSFVAFSRRLLLYPPPQTFLYPPNQDHLLLAHLAFNSIHPLPRRGRVFIGSTFPNPPWGLPLILLYIFT
ncbi:hypothetical protein F5Y01DRAFT_59646 [Xylaria sp. FL0043]|nr:hypothetical protein F5Y01DRAFT_59646 [Xylaria sp. FL0043]